MDTKIMNDARKFLTDAKAAGELLLKLEEETASQRLQIERLETVLKIMLNRDCGRITWTREELAKAQAEENALMLGSLELEYFDAHRLQD